MGWQGWVTIAVVVAMIYTLARDLLQPAVTVLCAAIALLLFGIITPAQTFSGFSNAAPMTVAALYVLAAAVEKTGALQPIVSAVLGRPGNQRLLLARMIAPAAGASAFLNNTPIVAMLSPQIRAWAERHHFSPSTFLMPLSFAAILGGVVTLIGTSTNIVVSGLLEAHGYGGFGMFEITPIGLPVALAGIAMMVVFTPMLLPKRRSPLEQTEAEVREFAINMRVVPDGPLDGYSVERAGLRNLAGLYLFQIERDRELIAPVGPNTTLHGGDRLTFVGKADQVVDVQRMRGMVSTEQNHILAFDRPEHAFFEAVIGESSPLVGTTLKDSDFRASYDAAVLAIHRAGERVHSKLGEVKLKVGDTLVLLAEPAFRNRWRDRNDFLLVSRMRGTVPMASRKALLVASITLGIVLAAALGIVPILQASLLGAALLIVLRVLSPAEARAAVDLDVIILIAASFGVGAALETTGVAAAIAGGLVGVFTPIGEWGALLGVILTTLLLTELITNNAAAVLMFPIAIEVATRTDMSVRAIAIALAIAASASFLTPIGYQTNTMVYGPGGYRFGDYARLGFPLTITVVVVTMLLLS